MHCISRVHVCFVEELMKAFTDKHKSRWPGSEHSSCSTMTCPSEYAWQGWEGVMSDDHNLALLEGNSWTHADVL